MKLTDNPFAFLRQKKRPDIGDEPRDFDTITLHRWCDESIQLRTRLHRDGFSTGWRVYMPQSGVFDVYPTPETGLFKDERDAHLFALGEILTQQSVVLTLPARRAVEQAIAQWRQLQLF